MTSFYKKLKAGEGRADALDATQKEFRNHSKPFCDILMSGLPSN